MTPASPFSDRTTLHQSFTFGKERTGWRPSHRVCAQHLLSSDLRKVIKTLQAFQASSLLAAFEPGPIRQPHQPSVPQSLPST